ncbi:MAG: DUF2141 domain-containing protein [Gammaproteobacteria bacterium]|nr:DUF2141 domain-containing protein [Gammaproteobacteria bacterium]
MMSYRFASVLLFLLLPLEASSEETANLTVRVQGVTPGQGEVEVTLFSDEESWMENAAHVLREPVGDEAWVDVLVPRLAPGDYAASVYYDQDGDGELDSGMFRIPKEPVGFSNDARGKFGPAKWDAARFTLDGDLLITVNVVKIR